MTKDTSAIDEKKRAALLLKKMQVRLEAAEARNREPIAVVGIACRFPGQANDVDVFWDNLNAGIDSVCEVPADRWDAAAYYDRDPAAPGKMNTRWGGFIDSPDLFDAGFFGITPREAVSMDPQQRLVLENAWRALEHAGIPPSRLSGSKTGVFLGVCTSDYARVGDADGQRGLLDTYSGTGGSNGVTAGRLSYTLGLTGPSLVVDTACSSSLVSVHLAINSLRSGESDLAIAGGVNLVLIPDGTITLSKLHMLAPDGRCKAFDEAANGFVRGEGCGLVVLQRLSQAKAGGARILAVISGSAVNQDGRSSGLTAPSGIAQERVVRDALANAQRQPEHVDYVEAHGTGTSLGDPIELDALQNVMGANRQTPLVVGSVKSNVGHLEAAAGIAGLIKAVGVVQTGKVPTTLHFKKLNSNVTNGAPALRIATAESCLPDNRALVAGVSSFGFSGTNAHVVLESPPATETVTAPTQQPEVVVLSARSEKALAALAQDLAVSLPDNLGDAAFTLAVGRDHFDFRMAFVAETRDAALTGLGNPVPQPKRKTRIALLTGKPPPGVDGATWLSDISQSMKNAGIPADAVLAHDSASADAVMQAYSVPGVIANQRDALSAASGLVINVVIVLGCDADTALLSLVPDAQILHVKSGTQVNQAGFADLAAKLYELGASIDWRQYYQGRNLQLISLPGHPFERRSYWRDRDRMSVGDASQTAHPLVGQKRDGENDSIVFCMTVTDPGCSHLGQHRVGDRVIVSAAALMEAVIFAARKCGGAAAIHDVVFESPLVLDEPRHIEVEIAGDLATVSSRHIGDGETIRHMTARIEAGSTAVLPDMPVTGFEAVDPKNLYQVFEAGGIHYGPDYRRILKAERHGNHARVQIAAADKGPHLIDPKTLDNVLQSLAVVTIERQGALRIPSACESFWLRSDPVQGDIFVSVCLREDSGQISADILGVDVNDHPVLSIANLRLSASDYTGSWHDHLFRRHWVNHSHPINSKQVCAQVDAGLQQNLQAADLLDQAAFGPRIDALARRFASQVVNTVARENVAAQHCQLYDLMSRWSNAGAQETDADRIDDEITRLKTDFPVNATEIDLLSRCGKSLEQVLLGEQNPLELVFGDQGNAAIYADAPVSRLLNDAVADAVLNCLPEDGPVRILEVGAGTGATTNAILKRLPEDRISLYSFTDIARSLVAKAKGTYADRSWLEPQVLDLENDLFEQGLDGEYDVIVAANVLHATRDIQATLSRLGAQLQPQGALIALEGVGHQGWVDLVFGMTAGWWAFDDHDVRKDHPMPASETWLRVLEKTGYEATLSSPGDTGLLDRQTIIVARKSTGNNWLVVSDANDLGHALSDRLGGETIAIGKPGFSGSYDGVVILTPSCQLQVSGEQTVAKFAEQLDAVRTIAIEAAENNLPLVLVTQSAFEGDMCAAGVWGLARAIATEYPETRLRSVDIDAGLDVETTATAIAQEITQGGFENQVRLGEDTRKVARLMPAHPSAPETVSVDPEGIHVVTGGFGPLGLRSAERLLELGATRLLLIGRSPPSAAASQLIDDLKGKAVSVACEVADIASGADVDRVFAKIDGSISGIVHCAGTLDDRPLTRMDKASFCNVMGPKIAGCLNLEPYAADADYFVGFSSAIGLVGASGQSNHIAANAMLDAFVERRLGSGLKSSSLAFGAWREIGAAASPALAAHMRQSGIGTIAPADGLALLGSAVYGQIPGTVFMLPLDVARLSGSITGAIPPLFRQLNTNPRVRPVTQVQQQAVPAISPAIQSDKGITLQALLIEVAAIVVADDPSDIDARRNLFDQGFDSLMAVELRNRLQLKFNVTLPSTLLFDFPVPVDLARWLAGDTEPGKSLPKAADTEIDDIAIVGMACRFPGGANDVETFWNLLAQGYDGVGPWPDDRPIYARDGSKPGPAAYIDNVAAFDASFFGISPREAISMDPQQRILLETTWHALEDAGIPALQLSGTSTGVYVGLCNNDYSQISAETGGIDAWSGTGGAPSVAAGRLAFVLGLEGPAMVVDTACSSSLVALQLASQALLDGSCETALACAANLILAPSTTNALAALNMLAPDGRCKAFDADADGFGRGEGVGVVVLKRQKQAIADGDHILATIRAIAVNQDGRSSSLTAPNGQSQEALFRNAHARCGMAPGDIDFLEAHGTGTALGDPIEMNAVKSVFGPGRSPDQPLFVGAVKSNVGHLEASAGMAGLIKTVLALNKREIPPNVHFKKLNTHIDLTNTPVVLPREKTPWPEEKDRLRCAGVSSFGFSGTNVHVVLQEPPQREAITPQQATMPVLLIVSGATQVATETLANRIASVVADADAIELHDVANSLLSGRSQLEWRVAVIASTGKDAARLLLQAEPAKNEDANTGDSLLVVSNAGDLEKTRDHFLSGGILKPADDSVRSNRKLPLYPFDRTSFWFEKQHPGNVPDVYLSQAHPLLGRRQRMPGSQLSFESEVQADHPSWLSDHKVDGRVVFPAAAMIDMMLSANGSRPVVLEDVSFEKLLDVGERVVINTAIDGLTVSLHATQPEQENWSKLAQAKIAEPAPRPTDHMVNVDCCDTIPVDAYYQGFVSQGLEYGSKFQPIEKLKSGNGTAVAELKLSEYLDHSPFCIHPALLDGAFQSIGAAARELDLAGSGFRPAALEQFVFLAPAGRAITVTSRVALDADGNLVSDLDLIDNNGQAVAIVRGLQLRQTTSRSGNAARLYDVGWEVIETHSSDTRKDFLVHQVIEGAEPDKATIGFLDAIRPSLDGVKPALLAVITRGAEVLPSDRHASDIAGAAVRGFSACLALEHPEFKVLTIDMLPGDSLAQRHFPNDAGHYALRDGLIFRRNLTALEPDVSSFIKLQRPGSGRLGDLAFKDAPVKQPAAGEVLISVVATGLNFRDVMNVLGAYPGDAGELGGECAGFIEAVGDGVTDLEPGMPVMAIAAGAHASHVVASETVTWPIPDGWSLEEAATAPTVYLTALALRSLADIGPGKSVLIHAAAGGVGLAALNIARASGAQVFATAGTEEKRSYLQGEGISCVSDSRSDQFHADVMQATHGEGVDIVLNSLSGDLISSGFDVLKSGGCFLEIGKAAVWNDEQAKSYRPDVTYTRVFLDQQIVEDPEQVRADWQSLQPEISTGSLPPLPVTRFSFDDPQPAYAFMRDARHIGRIVLTRQQLDSSASYIVTGGTGALGLVIARRLAELGATQIILVARGQSEPDAPAFKRLCTTGVDIQIRHVDLAKPEAVTELIESIDRPIRGIVHAAGILDDGVISNMRDASISTVMDAKLKSAVNLDAASRKLPLDFFVLISSAAGVFGSAGQANYAASNAGLDALASRRRQQGLPAVSIDYGAWKIGMASKRTGPAMDELTGLAAFEAALKHQRSQVVVVPADNAAALDRTSTDREAADRLQARLKTAAQGEWPTIIRAAILEIVGEDMRIPVDQISTRKPLHDYGLDSLLAVQVRNGLSSLTNETMPAGLLFDYPTIDALTDFLTQKIMPVKSQHLAKPAPQIPTIELHDEPGQEQDPASALAMELENAGY